MVWMSSGEASCISDVLIRYLLGIANPNKFFQINCKLLFCTVLTRISFTHQQEDRYGYIHASQLDNYQFPGSYLSPSPSFPSITESPRDKTTNNQSATSESKEI